MGLEQTLNDLFPTDWLDPYGHMPLNKEHSVQIDITQVETDDGIKVTAIKTPPHAGTTSIKDVINMALGMGCCDSEAHTSSPQSDDLRKRDDKKQDEKPGDPKKQDEDKPDFNTEADQSDNDEKDEQKKKAPK